MGRYLPIIMVALLAIYCIVEVAQAPPLAVRRMPRWLWATAIICLPLAGSICALVAARCRSRSALARPGSGHRRRHQISCADYGP
jgi:hypothetical protein